jgi:hypothetical protein
MRDGDDSFDDCEGWTEAAFIRRLSELPGAAHGRSAPGPGAALAGSPLSRTLIFKLATEGRVADLQHALTHDGAAGGEAWPRTMPDLFSTIGLLEARWQDREITFAEAIRGLFTIREVVRNLEAGRVLEVGSQHFFGSGLIGLADGERHVFGAQIVAEKLYVDGWRTEVNLKPGLEWMIGRLRQEYFHFVGISVGSDEQLCGLADQISLLRDVSVNRSIDVVLGGAVFAYSSGDFDFLGADCVARTADDAIRFLNTRLKITGSSLCH